MEDAEIRNTDVIRLRRKTDGKDEALSDGDATRMRRGLRNKDQDADSNNNPYA